MIVNVLKTSLLSLKNLPLSNTRDINIVVTKLIITKSYTKYANVSFHAIQ